MIVRSKHLGIAAAIIALLLIFFLLIWRQPAASANAAKIAFVGYTNANNSRFALFSVSNLAGYGIRWHGDWVEVEGDPAHRAKIVNPTLPGLKRSAVLNGGDSLLLAIGDPFSGPEPGRWRFSMSYSRYSIGERWLDFSFRHQLPLKLGPIVLVDAQRILNPTNHLILNSEWLAN